MGTLRTLRACETCGQSFLPRWGTSRGPHRFCSTVCSNKRPKTINPNSTRYRRARADDGRHTTAQRAMVEKALGHPLPPEVIVHHEDEDKLNNTMSNFRLMTSREHGLLHHPPRKSVTTVCMICETVFTPHKTKRERTKTCSPACKSALQRLRWDQRRKRLSTNGRPDVERTC